MAFPILFYLSYWAGYEPIIFAYAIFTSEMSDI